LQESPVLRNGPDVLDSLGGRSGESQKVSTPDAGILLLFDYGESGFGLGDRKVGGLDCLRCGVSLGSELAISTVSDGSPGVLQQPGEGDTVLGRQVQNRSWASVGRHERRRR
jgi:hypothetical protein